MPTVKGVTAPPNASSSPDVETSSPRAKPAANNQAVFERASEVGGIGCALLILLGIPYLVVRQCSAPPPTAEQLKAEAAKAENDQRRGFHCLSGWDGSNASLVRQVKEQLREPDSFEHIETRITPVVNGKHTIMMEYRARNGFGGMNVATAFGTVDHGTCEATLLSVGE